MGSRSLKRLEAVACTLAAALVVTGCSATGPLFSGLPRVQSNEAAIIVYRPSCFTLSGAYPNVYLDGVKQAALRNGGYVELRVPPGEHVVEAKGSILHWDGRVPVLTRRMRVEAARIGFVRLTIASGSSHGGGLLGVTVTLDAVSQEAASRELSSLRLCQ
ncbi:MAG TPA: DUF2846 domain-containing protein [Planctomycetota bacterium]|nr:DUF2846 domain-containing protein [Planctomycetota bacterium]